MAPVKITLLSPNAGNWVDRGDPSIPTLRRVLRHYFDRNDPAIEPWLEEQANVILGMVEAGATEIHIGEYLDSLMRDAGGAPRDRRETRTTSIALWHIAKAAIIRDLAERLLQRRE